MYRVLIIDDSDENLDILKAALKSDYKISVSKDGMQALGAIHTISPDLILLDIMMPGIDGYEVLTRIKKIKKFEETPVIFISGETSIFNKSRGFSLGAVDYITKPFDLLEVKLRIRTHLELSKSREERRDLLSNTLVGTIQAFLEILSVTNAFAYTFSNRMKKLTGSIAREMELEEIWKYEIAGMLSLIGTCMMSSETLEKIMSGKNPSLDEKKLFASHPYLGYKLLAKIPRLDELSVMIQNQMEPLGNLEFDPKNTIQSGSQILCVAMNYQTYITSGYNKKNALDLLKQNRAKNNIDVVRSLERVIDYEEEAEIKILDLKDLKNGMTIVEDIKSSDGNVIIKKGTGVNDLIIEHLKLLREVGKWNDRIHVRMDDNQVGETS